MYVQVILVIKQQVVHMYVRMYVRSHSLKFSAAGASLFLWSRSRAKFGRLRNPSYKVFQKKM